MLVSTRADAAGQIWCGQGPPPPNPMVVERFSQVISQLFQQVGDSHTNECRWLHHCMLPESAGNSCMHRKCYSPDCRLILLNPCPLTRA